MYLINKDGVKEKVYPYNWDVDIEALPLSGHYLTAREKYGKREHWYSEPMFIDTETSHLGDTEGWIHQWALQWCNFFVIGRRAEELTCFIEKVDKWIKNRAKNKGYNPKNWKVLGYIHNMSYDMEYMRAYFTEKEPDFFAVKPHRILTAKYEQVEIRCSYLLTQKSLEKWAKDSKAEHQKLVGSYDYDRIITPGQQLTDDDWAYQLGDCAAMSDSWHLDRQFDHYTTLNVPLTSTGFVRADCRESAFADSYWKLKLNAMQPDIEVYNALESAFMGGYTHGNRFYKQKVVRKKIGHRDFRSSYPARQMLNSFPMGKFTPIEIEDTDDVETLMDSTALLMHIAWKNPKLKDRKITAPYMSYSKVEPVGKITEVLDNGRIIELEGIVTMWVTEFDFMILQRQYAGEYQIVEAYSAPKGKLPKWLRNRIMEYFHAKTTLKFTDPTSYMWGKGKLNAIYGMTAERYIRAVLEYVAGEWIEKALPEDDREAALQKSIKKENTFLPFAWGTWTTALARYALFECIELVGYDKYLYCDTDSIFYIMDEETEETFEEYNQDIIEQADNADASLDYKGKHYALGEFTPEDDMPVQAFTFVHAKCYALIDNTGKLQCTVAGVTKHYRDDNTKTNADELEDISNLKTGFTFRHCGGSRIVYNNKPLHTITVNGEEILCGSSAIIMPTDYVVNDIDNLDTEDEQLINMIISTQVSDTYGNFIGIK